MWNEQAALKLFFHSQPAGNDFMAMDEFSGTLSHHLFQPELSNR
jgi:hypothetical protein